MPLKSSRFQGLAWALAALLALSRLAPAQQTNPSIPQRFEDPALRELRKASVTWEVRKGPQRQVLDVVCLVPDVPTFFQAIALWDETRFFPILIDDVETNLKFLREFHPSAVVRYSNPVEPIAEERLWVAAVESVGRSWISADREQAGPIPDGSKVPVDFGPTPPGVVLSEPGSPALPGAVALAAGHFQPLWRWQIENRNENAVLSEPQAVSLMHELEIACAKEIPESQKLGDDCDFLTLVGRWPDRYRSESGSFKGINALDDLLGRSKDNGRRWAYVGRLLGTPAQSVYRAMCSLFLNLDSALLFNAYDQKMPPWSHYDLQPAARRLEASLPLSTVHRAGPIKPDVMGWHATFDPVNRADLVLINTSGGPTSFNLDGGPGQTADVPTTEPAAVLMVHSFSAARPGDPGTIAGRWLSNGAFLYFGSINEPYLQAFRSPTLVGDLIAHNLPFAAAVRQLHGEPFGHPWRLHFLGDPLFRLVPAQDRLPRAERAGPLAAFPQYDHLPRPPEEASHETQLGWALKSAIVFAAEGRRPTPRSDYAETLLRISRDRLSSGNKDILDALVADSCFQIGQLEELCDYLAGIPEATVSADGSRWLETARVAALERALTAGNWPEAAKNWDRLLRSASPRELKSQVTERLGREARGAPARLEPWLRQLEVTRQSVAATPAVKVIEREMKQVEERLRTQSKP